MASGLLGEGLPLRFKFLEEGCMRRLRESVAWGLVLLMFSVPLCASDAPLGAETLSPANSVKQQVSLFGVGAKVKVKLAGGARLRGSIEAIEAGRFWLRMGKESAAKPISYEELAQVKLARITYNGSRGADSIEARRVITALGAGKHVVVRTAEKQEYHGNIQSIEPDHFMMLPDTQTAPVRIAYSEVTAAGPNLSKGAKITIIALIGVAVTVAVIAIIAVHGKKLNGI